MGEKKRRAQATPQERLAHMITKSAADRGALLATGFAALLAVRYPDGPPAGMSVDELRRVYFAGCEHLWSSIMSTLDPGVDETPADLDRMDKIQREIDAYRKEAHLWVDTPKGNA